MPEGTQALQLLLSAVALLVSLGTAVYTARRNRRLSSSDYAAAEQVKSDTARLIATIRSVIQKALYSIITGKSMPFDREQRAVSDFLAGPTGFAYWAWVGKKNKEAKEHTPEVWRVFFNNLMTLSQSTDKRKLLSTAVEVEQMFNSLTKKDIGVIVSFNYDLVNAIANIGGARDPFVEVAFRGDGEKEGEKERKKKLDKIEKQFVFLKEAGVDDPQVDLVLAAFTGDEEMTKAALDAGADPTIAIGDVLERHRDRLREFDYHEKG